MNYGSKLLDGIKLSDKDKRRLRPVMQNWMKVHAYMIQLEDNWQGYEELRRMLAFELGNARRVDVARRIFGRMMMVSRDLLQQDLLARF